MLDLLDYSQFYLPFQLNIGYLTAAAILLMMLWITFVYMYIKIVTIYYQWG